MKKISIIYYTILLLGFVGLHSCYEDKTTTGTISNTIIVDTTGWNFTNDMLEVSSGSILRLTPKVTQTGTSSMDNLDYRWVITASDSKIEGDTLFVSDQLVLEKKVNWLPGDDFYSLFFTVTDRNTGVQYINRYKILVVSGTGDGIVIADTRDGSTSDLTLVRNKYVSTNYSGETKYIRDNYSLINGEKFDGIIKSLHYSPGYNMGNEVFRLYLASDDKLETILSSSYAHEYSLEDLFLFPPTLDKKVQYIGSININTVLSYGGDIYTLNFNSNVGNLFTEPINYVKPGEAAKKFVADCIVTVPWRNYPQGNYFDATKGQLLAFSFGGSITAYKQGTSAHTYDPSALQGYTPLGTSIGEIKTISGDEVGDIYFILKAPDGSIAYYTVHQTYDESTNTYEYTSGDKLTTTACAEIGDARFFESCEIRPIVYYATSTKVYNGIINEGPATISATTPAFTVPSGEEITCIKLFREAWTQYTHAASGTEFSESRNNLMVATYNSSTQEGKVYLLKIQGNTGTLETPTEDRIFTGFGKITALGVQGKQ